MYMSMCECVCVYECVYMSVCVGGGHKWMDTDASMNNFVVIMHFLNY